MDGSTVSVVAERPRIHGARRLLAALVLTGALIASFAIGRLSAAPGDGISSIPGTSQLAPQLPDGPPEHAGAVKQG